MSQVAVKYCGGCNPCFDRVAFVARFFDTFPQLKQVNSDVKDPWPWLTLVICGCSRCCAEHHYIKSEKVLISSAEEYEILCKKVSVLS